MRSLFSFLLAQVWASAGLACDRPVCAVAPEDLQLARVVTFDNIPSSFGIGRKIDGILEQDGVRFGERFVGQSFSNEAGFDRVTGAARAPLTLLPGAPNETLGILRLMRTSVLQGHGPTQYPRADAVGEGAIAVAFDTDQSAIALDIRGGEMGHATLSFLRRDGSTIDTHRIGPLGEASYAFQRNPDTQDIAGLVLTNDDPEGIALDNLRFDQIQILGLLQ
ncbi:hypothetical protein CSC82_17115 [Rhodobacteraceae bacterium 4F10]|nr:hypothetical protein CSC82_17115 [Rhodobacteraceae bacterium 4F10]